MEEQLKFVTDLLPLMKMVKSCIVSLDGLPKKWCVEVSVIIFWDSLFVVLDELKNKNYSFSIESVNKGISIVVRHPDYIPF